MLLRLTVDSDEGASSDMRGDVVDFPCCIQLSGD